MTSNDILTKLAKPCWLQPLSGPSHFDPCWEAWIPPPTLVDGDLGSEKGQTWPAWARMLEFSRGRPSDTHFPTALMSCV